MGNVMTRPSMSQQAEPAAPSTPTASGVAERDPKTKPSPPALDRLPPYRVILHNDDVNDMRTVVETIVDLTPHPPPRAFELMLTAHTRGRALLLVTHRERAELYQDQFRSRRLIVTIEKAD